MVMSMTTGERQFMTTTSEPNYIYGNIHASQRDAKLNDNLQGAILITIYQRNEAQEAMEKLAWIWQPVKANISSSLFEERL